MKKLPFGLLIVALLISACGRGKATSTLEPTTAPEAAATPRLELTEEPSWKDTIPLIPREVLFGNPDKSQAKLSPDGTKISYLAPVDGVMNIWMGPADDPAAAQPVTHDTDSAAFCLFDAENG